MKNLHLFTIKTIVPFLFLYQKGMDTQIENFESFKTNEDLNTLDTTTNLENEETKTIRPLENNSLKLVKENEKNEEKVIANKIVDFPPTTEGWPPSDEYLASLDTDVKAVDNTGKVITNDSLLAAQTTVQQEKPNTDSQKSESKEAKQETEEIKTETFFASNQGGAEIDLTNPTNKIATEDLIAQSKLLDNTKEKNTLISGVPEDNNITTLT